MRNTMKFGIGVGTAAIVATMSAGVAAATTGGQQATRSVAAVSAVSKHITGAEARQIGRARVPRSRVIEVESDDLHNRAVWKVTLTTPHGRVVVDVDKKTGKATIVRQGGGRDLAVTATVLAGQRSQAGDDRGSAGDDRGVGSMADDHGRDARDHDGGREERGERHDHAERGDRRDDGRGDQDGRGQHDRGQHDRGQHDRGQHDRGQHDRGGRPGHGADDSAGR